jgi:DNA primase
MLDRVCHILGEAMRTSYVRIEVDETSAYIGDPRTDAALAETITVGGRTLGRVLLGPRLRVGDPCVDVLSAFCGMVRAGPQGLLAAVIAGLARFPHQIDRHAEALTRLARIDREAAPLIESLFELAETLDSQAATAICDKSSQPAPPADIRYAFLDEGTSTGDSCEELAEAVSLLVERPALEAALAATIARFDGDPEGSFAEQTRPRAQLMTVDERLKAFGRRKAAPVATGDDAATAADLG